MNEIEETEINFLADKFWVPTGDPKSQKIQRFCKLDMENLCRKEIDKNEYNQLAEDLGADITKALRIASVVAYNYFECDRRRRGLV